VGTDRATYTTAAADVGAVFTVTVTADGYLGSASAGVTIIAPGSTIFDNVGNLKTWLQGQPANTAANPYEVTLNVDLSELEDNPAGNEYDALYKLFDALSGKYVSIDLSGCTGTGLAPSNPDYRPNTDKLIRITLPSTLTNIGDTVFYNVENLTHIDLPEGIVTIGIMAFTQCPALIEIDLPSTITDLGLNIFDEHLERIICRAVTPPVFGHAAYLNSFINLNALVSIRVPAGSVNNYKSAQGWSFKASIISALP
jgi:hypothetical protein